MNQAEQTARLRAMSAEEQREEINRQAQVLAASIGEAVKRTMDQFEIPLGNAVLRALVVAEAEFLGILDESDRRASIKALDHLRPVARANAVRRHRDGRKVVSVRRLDA